MAAQPRLRLHEYSVADLPVELAAFMARSQVFNAANNFQSSHHYALHVGAKKDRTINPHRERWYATHSKSQATVIRSMSPDHKGKQ
jgi:hypothetical protein